MRPLLTPVLAGLVLAGLTGAGFAQTVPAGSLSGIEATVRACFAGAAPGESAPDCLGAGAQPCTETPEGMTTHGTAQCLAAETAVWDDLLNTEYKALRAQMLAQGEGLGDSLLDAQRAWIAFRDADCAFDYARWGDGSIRQIVGANCLMQMTAARAIALRDKRDGS